MDLLITVDSLIAHLAVTSCLDKILQGQGFITAKPEEGGGSGGLVRETILKIAAATGKARGGTGGGVTVLSDVAEVLALQVTRCRGSDAEQASQLEKVIQRLGQGGEE